ncbi:MAG TPA: tellurite resistance TerB family protein [Candidatus Thermoplasmatota archaeon]|nr:tellurite resistance TerB family protein [Candidatus Thermoplasmatota archaeon]
MGLFDKVLGGGSTNKLSEQEGLAGIALAAIASDGMITQEEAAGLGTTLSRMKLYAGMSDRDVNKVFEKLIKLARSEGVDTLLRLSSDAVRPELKQTAFAVAADLLMADGDVAAEEKRFLEKIQRSLGVEDDAALKIVEVMSIKNRG